MLAANRVLGDDGTFISSRELAESTELPLDLVQRLHDAAGLARAEDQADASTRVPMPSLFCPLRP